MGPERYDWRGVLLAHNLIECVPGQEKAKEGKMRTRRRQILRPKRASTAHISINVIEEVNEEQIIFKTDKIRSPSPREAFSAAMPDK